MHIGQGSAIKAPSTLMMGKVRWERDGEAWAVGARSDVAITGREQPGRGSVLDGRSS